MFSGYVKWEHQPGSTLLKKVSYTGVFLLLLWNFLRTHILRNICERLLLSIITALLSENVMIMNIWNKNLGTRPKLNVSEALKWPDGCHTINVQCTFNSCRFTTESLLIDNQTHPKISWTRKVLLKEGFLTVFDLLVNVKDIFSCLLNVFFLYSTPIRITAFFGKILHVCYMWILI